jgi:GGDEF domain-containing protein
MAEKVLQHAVGPCMISLWCPDAEHKTLIECVVRQTHRPSSESIQSAIELPVCRRPHQVPLRSPEIREALMLGNPYLRSNRVPGRFQNKVKEDVSLHSDGCIPLPRDYGQPLLINIEFVPDPEEHAKERKHALQDGYSAAVKLIHLFWKHLQATNQRQWIMEHDPTSGVLRCEVFLDHGQMLAKGLWDRDEVFSLVVLTVQGFRRTFKVQSQQWYELTALMGRCLRKIIVDIRDDFLLSKMADDVFAVLLPRTDEFLAESIMQRVQERLPAEMEQDPVTADLNIMAIDVQWTAADQKQYPGNIERMLDKMYRRLFTRADNKQPQTYRILLAQEKSPTV